MSVELVTAVDSLTTQTTNLLDTCSTLKDDTAQLISAAVVTSVNGTVEPLIQVATNLIDTQTLLVTLISGGST
tara:strand:- start:1540 stop:1758 length:219 start_codon:yes stop_codon:yes gene_type:complete